MYARQTGKTPFVVYQGAWNVVDRDIEREIIPMVKAEGMALSPWNVLAAGKIRTDAEEDKRRETGEKGGCRGRSPGSHLLLNIRSNDAEANGGGGRDRADIDEPELGARGEAQEGRQGARRDRC